MRLGMEAGGAGELPESGDPVLSMHAANADMNEEPDVSLINPVSIVYFIWCAGALFMFCITIGAYRDLRKLRMSSCYVNDRSALEMLFQLKRKIGIRRLVALKVSSEIYTPTSLGILSHAIILPDGVIDGRIRALEMILTHELAHIKRYDYLINFLQNMLRAIFFFHPLFHLMNRRLTSEREHICDDWVIDVTKQRSGYAECIISLLERALHKPIGVPVTVAMAERKRDIPGRIDMIVDKKRRTATEVSRKASIVMLLVGCLSLPIVGGMELVRFAGARQASDEGWIVFTRKSGIWVMDDDGKSEKHLTHDPANCTEVSASWSPDGKRIAFSIEVIPVSCIYIMNADGSNMKQLTNPPPDNYDYDPAWSPDGKQIAFSREVWVKKDGKWDIKSGGIYLMDADGANVKRLTHSFDEHPDWSPDGKKIVFNLYRPGHSNKLGVVDADGSNRRILRGGGYPAWSPDGKRIAFISGTDAWRINRAWGSCDVYVMDVDGSNVEILTQPDPSLELYPSWSPDGTKIAFCSNRDGNYEIYVMHADGSNVQRLTNTPERECWPEWWGPFSYAVEPAGKLRSTWGKLKRKLFSRP